MTTSRRCRLTALALTATAGLGLITLAGASATPAAAGSRAAGGPTPQATLVARIAGADSPIDASPDPTGRTIYFTADGPAGPGVFEVPAAGGAYQPVHVGAPLRGPTGLVVSGDGREIFVADRAASRIYVVAVTGGATHVLRGTAGTAPRDLDVQTRAGREYVVYTGSDPRDGRPAVMRIAAGGARMPTVLQKSTVHSPDGVAVARTGAIYVSDQDGSRGRVLRIAGNRVSTVASGVTLGHPGGIALTLDESKLLISSLKPTARTAQVVIVDLSTGRTTTFDRVIGANHHPGGLHRARAAATMGWAGVSRSGPVYRIDP